jgi:hypothetical protein
MHVKRTFSLEPDVDRFLSMQGNRSQVVNSVIKRYMQEIEQQAMIQGYQAMGSSEAMPELAEWEQATLHDGLESGS